jgi:hypothetical protein
MKNPAIAKSGMAIWVAALALLGSAPGFSQNESGQGQAVVTLLPKAGVAAPLNLPEKDLLVTVNNKKATVTGLKSLQGPENSVELVLMIDGSARGSLGTQFTEIEHFINTLPANTKIAIGYMQNGQTTFAAPLSSSHTQVLTALHLPGGMAGSSASPYFCLSDLAKHWPSADTSARRVVVMVTDGVDPYHLEIDMDDPYVEAAINDSVHAGLVVYSIYWLNQGRFSSTGYGNFLGQNLLQQVTQATGGKSFWIGVGNPVSFQPFFEELARRLQNQYELGFTSNLNGKAEVAYLKLKLKLPGTEVSTPQQVWVSPATK